MAYQGIPATPAYWPYAGTVLTDADTTIEPFTDKAGVYVLPAGTLTANRVLTVNNTGGIGPWALWLAVYDLSASTYTIKNSATTTIFTKAASPGRAILFQIYSASGGAWVANIAQYINPR